MGYKVHKEIEKGKLFDRVTLKSKIEKKSTMYMNE
jgi:hypothetical protein